MEKPSETSGSVTPVPKQRTTGATGETGTRSSVPPPRPTAMPRTKSDYNVETTEPSVALIRNQSDTNLETKADVSPPTEPTQRSIGETVTMGADASAMNHFGKAVAQDSVKEAEKVLMPPPSTIPPALPPGFAGRGPPPPLPASRPVGVLPSGNQPGMSAGNLSSTSIAQVPARRPDNNESPPAPVPAPRPGAVAAAFPPVSNSAGLPAPILAPRPDAVAPAIPRRDNVPPPAPKTAATDGENEVPFIPPRPKAIPPVTTSATAAASTSVPPVIPARSAASVPPLIPSRSNIPPPAVPPRQTNNS